MKKQDLEELKREEEIIEADEESQIRDIKTRESSIITDEYKNKYLKTNFFFRFKENVLVIDAPMGCGKTSSILNYIEQADSHVKFLYVTPYLTEVERIQKECPSKHFVAPSAQNKKGTKMFNFRQMIKKGENIVITHELFKNLSIEEFEGLNELQEYFLVMDEVANVIEPLQINKSDVDNILKNYATVDKEGKLIWTYKDKVIWNDVYINTSNTPKKNFKRYNLAKLCEYELLYVYGGKVFVWIFPVEIFKMFAKSILITYMFDGQIQGAYYKMHNVGIKYLHIQSDLEAEKKKHSNKNYWIEDNIYDRPQEFDMSIYKSLINICDNKKLNAIGDSYFFNKKLKNTNLSKSWYNSNSRDNPKLITQLKNNTYNYFFNITKTKTEDNMWTTFEAYKDQLKGKGYTSGFVPCNARATNDYRNKKSLAYLCNRYIHPIITNFLEAHKVEVDQDKFALSEMIQWIFRSQIRQYKPINIYIPSERMRELLIDWLNCKIQSGTFDDIKINSENIEEYYKENNDINNAVNIDDLDT